MKYSHLNLTDRCIIEKGIAIGLNFHEIAASLNCSPSTVMREIKNNRIFVTSSRTHCVNFSNCLKRKICGNKVCFDPCKTCRSGYNCHEICKEFKPTHCDKLDKSPYVCNSCDNRNYCSKERAIYSAHRADAKSRERLSQAHQIIQLSDNEIIKLNELVTPLMKNGQSVNHIFSNHSEELCICRKTLYNYIDKCVLDIRNIDLPRKVRYKKRKKQRSAPKPYKFRNGRTYEDFQTFVKENPDMNVVEMDTVKGTREKGKCLLTLIFVKYDFMLIFLIDSATQKCVKQVFDYLESILGIHIFERLFPIILTDNGGEFADPESLEHTEYGTLRTRIFYCDPMASWQKPHIERSHEYIRQIIPKGVPMDELTQDDITLMTNHINSLCRDSLNGSCPFDAAKKFIGRKLPKFLDYHKIQPDNVHLRPSLFKR